MSPRMIRGVLVPPKLTVARLAARDGAYCPHCGRTDTLTVQHRIRRGKGGDPFAERLSNGCLLCWSYNCAIEQDAALMAEAEGNGWRLRSWQSTEVEPFWDVRLGLWVRVFDDGSRLESVVRPTP